VLRVKASIVNLYLNAPDAGNMGRSRTIVRSAGEMTLLAELYDSASGQLLARVADRREANDSGRMQLANNVVNEGEARAIAAGMGARPSKGTGQGTRASAREASDTMVGSSESGIDLAVLASELRFLSREPGRDGDQVQRHSPGECWSWHGDPLTSA
jgi:hypothetical protein